MQSHQRIQLKIEGMTCIACKELIEKELRKQEGVLKVTVKLERNIADIEFSSDTVSVEKLTEVVESLDYKVTGTKEPSSKENTKKDILQMIGLVLVAGIAYFIINATIGFNFMPEITTEMGFGVLFLIGVLTSFHCISMCGGINLSQCLPKKEGDSRVLPSILYNSGRVVSYTVLGGIVGGIGSVVSFSNTTKGMIAILAGVFMVIMGLSMLNIFPIVRKIAPRAPKFFKKIIYSEKQGKGPFVVGLLNGLIPCGPLQAMQIYALGTGSVMMGALSMFFFSLGTVPLMFGLGTLGAMLGSKFTSKMIKVGAVLVIVLGVIMAGRGFALSGHHIAFPDNFTTNKTQSDTSDTNTIEGTQMPEIKDGKQIVVSDLQGGVYKPITVAKGIPVKWIIQANAEDINGCNNILIVPQYNIEKNIVPGENIIEFIPDSEGIIPYTCWMGMIRSKITVQSTEGKQSSKQSSENIQEVKLSKDPTAISTPCQYGCAH